MLHIVTWLGIYAFLLVGIGRAVEQFATRRWFKILFLPGTLLAIGVQVCGSVLCVGRAMKLEPIRSGRPAFTITPARMGTSRV